MDRYIIDFEPLGLRGQPQDNESILDLAHQCGAGINSICGGQGTCGSCKVQILGGTVSEPTSSELKIFSSHELKDGWRLACMTNPVSDCKVSVPPESMSTPQRTQLEGIEIGINPVPATQAYRSQLQKPSLANPQADADQLLKTLKQQHGVHCTKVDVGALRDLSLRLRSQDWECRTTVRNDEVIAVSQWPGRQLGLAIDLGTTKIAGYLIDLSNGKTIAAKGMMNPQISYGEDVVSRMSGTINSSDDGDKMQNLVIGAINEMAHDLCGENSANTDDIVEIEVAGNTVMHHLFLGLPVRQLALSPYIPVVNHALEVKARDLNLNVAKGAFVHLLPNIGGFIGADHVAMLLATKNLWHNAGLTLAIDIGTNTEVSLINGGNITAVSCASGPAFEGAHIKNGMRAARGAIERVRISRDSIQFQTIDDAPPIGICGSGIFDVTAQLYLAGIIDESGRMHDGHSRVHTSKKQREFWLVSKEERDGLPPIVITQNDIRAVQLAKAAIRTGIQLLLETNSCIDEEIKGVIIAGAFGSYIDVASAMNIGMLPVLPLDRFQQVGNAAGAGTKLALISLSQRDEIQSIASGVNYLELADQPGFMDTFIQANYFGLYRIKNSQREEAY